MNIEFLKKYYNDNNLPVQKFNLFGIRDESGIKNDVINDKLGFWTDSELFICSGTTDPGVYWTLSKEHNEAGTFHLLEGHHKAIWTFGIHKGYSALVNDYKYCRPTKGWRDSDFDFAYSKKDRIVCDYFGVNFHRMHSDIIVKLIGKYSAGCQVVQNPKDFAYILQRAKESGEKVFNYMLFRKEEVHA